MPVRHAAKRALHTAGWYARRLERDAFPGVLVLCYHGLRRSAAELESLPFANLHIPVETFESHCRLLAESCHPIDLATLQRATAGTAALPERPVLVTFDDGYRSVFELARPTLRRFRIPAAVFVCSQPIQEQRLFWFDAVARSRGEAHVQALRALPDDQRRAAAAAFDVAPTPADPLAPMTRDQVRELAEQGFAVGVHTASHPALGDAPDKVQRDELAVCSAAIEAWTGGTPDTLAYPFGARRADYTAETVAIASRLNFRTGFTTNPGFARPDDPPLELSRFMVLASVSAAELAHRIAVAWPRERAQA